MNLFAETDNESKVTVVEDFFQLIWATLFKLFDKILKFFQ